MKSTHPDLFFQEVIHSFQDLITDFNYELISTDIENADDYRDTVALVRYLGDKVGLEVYWYLADHAIGVSLIEVKKKGAFPYKRSFWGKSRGDARAINLTSLMHLTGKSDLLILDKYGSTKTADVIKRKNLIEENLSGIVINIASVLREQARDILNGDTSIFPKVQKYEEESRKKMDLS